MKILAAKSKSEDLVLEIKVEKNGFTFAKKDILEFLKKSLLEFDEKSEFIFGMVFELERKLFRFSRIYDHEKKQTIFRIDEKNDSNFLEIFSGIENLKNFFLKNIGENFQNYFKTSLFISTEFDSFFNKNFPTNDNFQKIKLPSLRNLLDEKVSKKLKDFEIESLNDAKFRLREIEFNLRNQDLISNSKRKTTEKLNTVEKNLKSLEDEMLFLKLKSDPEKEKIENEKKLKSLEKRKLEIEEELGESLKKKIEIKKLKAEINEIVYFKNNPPRTILPKIESLIKDEKIIEKTYNEKKIELESKKKELEEIRRNLEAFEKLETRSLFGGIEEKLLSIEETEKKISNKKSDLLRIKSQEDRFTRIIFALSFLFFLISIFFLFRKSIIVFFLSVFSIITLIGINYAKKTKSEVNRILNELKKLEDDLREKINLRNELFNTFKVKTKEELETLIKRASNLSISMKSKQIEIDNLEKGINETVIPKLNKFKSEKEKILKESGYESLQILMEKCKEYQEKEKKLDDLEFSMIKNKKDDNDDLERKKKEEEYEKILAEYEKIKEVLEKCKEIKISDEESQKARKEILKKEKEIKKLKTSKEFLEEKIKNYPEINFEKLKIEKEKLESVVFYSGNREKEIFFADSLILDLFPEKFSNLPGNLSKSILEKKVKLMEKFGKNKNFPLFVEEKDIENFNNLSSDILKKFQVIVLKNS